MDLGWYNDLNEWFPNRDQSFVPIWGASWSDYSGCGWIVILERDGQLYTLEGGVHPEASSNEPEWLPIPVSYEEAMRELEEWEEFLTA
jgi:hypothetical protein